MSDLALPRARSSRCTTTPSRRRCGITSTGWHSSAATIRWRTDTASAPRVSALATSPQDPELEKRVDPDLGAQLVINYLQALL